MKRPIIIIRLKKGSCSRDTPEKSPIPHKVYEKTPSAVAKKLIRDMADEVI